MNNGVDVYMIQLAEKDPSDMGYVGMVEAINKAKSVGAKIIGIVGRDGGFTKQMADACVIIPTLVADRITPHVEGICSVILHLLVSHPALKSVQTKWESVK